MEKDEIESFKCPNCQSTDCWFDRTVEIIEDNEEWMNMRCGGCGKSFRELGLD